MKKMKILKQFKMIKRAPILAVIFSALVFINAASANITATWTGNGADNNWSTVANWSTNDVPTSTTEVVFNGTSTKVSTIDATITVNSITIASAYTGAISHEATLTVNTTFELQAGGYFISVVNPATGLTVNGSFSLPAANTNGRFQRFSGAGTSASPFVIYDVYGLQAVNCNLNKVFSLAGNIDAVLTTDWNPSGANFSGFLPIGTSGTDFTGTFNGGSFEVSNLYISRGLTSSVGLFGSTSGATISNIGVTNESITGAGNTGGLIGSATASTTITGCYATGEVTGSTPVGGLVGNFSSSSITNCYTTVGVKGTTKIGGLAGAGSGSSPITNSYATGNVTGTGNYVGGLVGINESTGAISGCYATGIVNGRDSTGGLAGYSDGIITNCYATGNVFTNATNNRAGGLVGYNISAVITNSYATGNVAGDKNRTGGLVGENKTASISNCYATGTVTGTLTDTGGLVGLHNSSAAITNSYATGNVTGSGNDTGGLVGRNVTTSTITNSYASGEVSGTGYVGGLVGTSDSGSITNCYARGNAAGTGSYIGGLAGLGGTITSSYFSGTPDNSIGTLKTAAQMQQRATFSGWDFSDTWLIDENKQFPYLTFEAFNWNGASGGNWATGSNWKKNLIVQGSAPSTNNDSVYLNTTDTISIASGTTLGKLQLGTAANNVDIAGNVTIADTGDREGSLYLLGGDFDSASFKTSIYGNFRAKGGTFTRGTGTFELLGTGSSSIEGNTTFNDFTCSVAGKIITFEAGSVSTIEGTLTLNGASGNLLVLRSNTASTRWNIDPTPASLSVNFVDVMDSNNIDSQFINPTNSIGLNQNNINWFAPTPEAPTNFTAVSVSTSELRYTWTDNTTWESGYRILDGSGNTIINSLPINTTTTTETGLLPNTQYTREAQAYHALWSSTSGTASSYTSIESPSGITFSNVTAESVTLKSSNDPSNLSSGSSGILFRMLTPAQDNSGWITTNTWTASNLTFNTLYTFDVTTKNGDGVIGGTAEGSVSTSTTDPTDCTATPLSSTSMSVTWENASLSNITTNHIEISTDGNSYSGAGTTDGSLESYTSTGLSASTIYWFRVRAEASGVYSNYSTADPKYTLGTRTVTEMFADNTKLFNSDIISANVKLSVSFVNDNTSTNGTSEIVSSTFRIYIDGSLVSDGTSGNYDTFSEAGNTATFEYTVKTPLTVGTHVIRVTAYDYSGNIYDDQRTDLKVMSESIVVGRTIPYPNPYDPSSGNLLITYNLGIDTNVAIYIFDVNGKLVWRNNYFSGFNGGKAGYNEVTWSGKSVFGGNVKNGLYLIRVIESGTRKLLGKAKVLVLRSTASKSGDEKIKTAAKPSGGIAMIVLLFVGLALFGGSMKYYKTIKKMRDKKQVK